MAYGATWYCDADLATGNDDGTSWANAWRTFQQALDNVTVDEVCYCRGTDTLAANCDMDTNSGNHGVGYITFIGCAANGDVDGTRFVIDGVTSYVPINAGAVDYVKFQNFELKNSVSSGFVGINGCDRHIWVNCISHSNAAHGWDMTGCDDTFFWFCQSYSNTSSGWANWVTHCGWYFSTAYANGAHGWDSTTGPVAYYGCISHDNGGAAGERGFALSAVFGHAINCIADGENVGMEMFNDRGTIIGNRITNNTTGFDWNNQLATLGWNYFHGNTADHLDPTDWQEEHKYAGYITLRDEVNTNKSGTDDDDGYTDVDNHDFNLKASRTYNTETDDALDLEAIT
jgi:hypothetical protein